MRLILHNPHSETHFGNTLLNFINKTYSFKKYQYLLYYLLKNNKPFVIYYDHNSSSLPPYLSKFISGKVEIYLWALINHINPFRLKLINTFNDIKKDDVFLSFSLGNLDKKMTLLRGLKNKKFIKIFHLTHYVINTSIISENVKKLRIDFLIAENNLYRNSKYFRKHFSFFKKDVYYLPYVFQSRFMKKEIVDLRKNKCVATGTLIQISQMVDYQNQFKDFLNFYHVDIQHPVRQLIYENKKRLSPLIDSRITPFWEVKRKNSEIHESSIKTWQKRIHNALFASRRKYFNFNIVDEYNNYKMFIVPEEINDFPGISFVEGMACGTAYIGKLDSMYADLGLKPGVHYIGYDGSLKDLTKKIRYYQLHPKELEKIAQNGYEYVTKHFNGEAVASKFWNDLEKLVGEYKKNRYNSNKLIFKSSYL